MSHLRVAPARRTCALKSLALAATPWVPMQVVVQLEPRELLRGPRMRPGLEHLRIVEDAHRYVGLTRQPLVFIGERTPTVPAERPPYTRRRLVTPRRAPLRLDLLRQVTDEERDGGTVRLSAVSAVAVDHRGGLFTGPDPDRATLASAFLHAAAHRPLEPRESMYSAAAR